MSQSLKMTKKGVQRCFVQQFTLLALHICVGWLYRLGEGVRKKRLTSRYKYPSGQIIIRSTKDAEEQWR